MKTSLFCLLLSGRAMLGLAGDPLDTWTKRSDLVPTRAIAFGTDRFVAMAETPSVSFEGSIWTNYSRVDTSGLFQLKFGNGIFLALGGTSVATTADGVNWVRRQIGTTARLTALGSGKGVFVVGGAGGAIWTTTDGTDWKLQASPTNRTILDIAFADGQFVAVGVGGLILRSTDAVQWNNVPSPLATSSGSGRDLLSVAKGAGGWVAVGRSGLILFSPDGEHWTELGSFTTDNFNQVAYGSGHFVACTATGKLWSSRDGENWITRPLDTASSLYSCAFGLGTFVAGGSGIFQSAPVVRSDVENSSLAIGLYLGLRLHGTLGTHYLIESSPALSANAAWTELTRLNLSTQDQLVIDENGVPTSSRFYRVRPLP